MTTSDFELVYHCSSEAYRFVWGFTEARSNYYSAGCHAVKNGCSTKSSRRMKICSISDGRSDDVALIE